MRSKVTVLGHPIHPMLVAFPVVLYLVTLVALVAYGAGAAPFWLRLARGSNAVALVAALVAALPGAIDLFTVVPRGRARRVARGHAAANLVAVAFFASTFALILLRPAGWLGWS